MNNLKTSNKTLLFLLALSSPSLAAQNIHYKGELIAGVCELIVNDDIAANVDFHTLSYNAFDSNNQTTHIPFSLTLKNCQTSLANGVLVSFSGTEDSILPGLLKLDESSVASGFAIGIETAYSTPIAINSNQKITFSLSEGITTINLRAWLQKYTSNIITPGEFTGKTTIEFEYQ